MHSSRTDVIIVGGRCAGASTALLLARRGVRVCLLERVEFPRDTISTHYIQQSGVDYLRRWRVLEAVTDTGCPAIPTVTIYSGPRSVRTLFIGFGSAGPGYCPRRSHLDSILLRAAAAAGADVRNGCDVKELLFEKGRVSGVRYQVFGGARDLCRSDVVIGADGAKSSVARMIDAPIYASRPMKNSYLYAYWSRVALAGGEIYFGARRAATAFPTNGDLACVAAVLPSELTTRLKASPRLAYLEALRCFPTLFKRLEAGRIESGVFTNWGKIDSHIRKPFGPGWALAGDAGCFMDHLAAIGITNAFRDAEHLGRAVREHLGGASRTNPFERYEKRRNDYAKPLYSFTGELEAILGGCAGERPLAGRPTIARMIFGGGAGSAHILGRRISAKATAKQSATGGP